MIDRTKPVPLYWQIKETLEKEISEGKYNCGDIIATEESLVEKFKVSRITAMKTLNTLEREGYVKRERTKGTILISPYKRQDDKLVLFLLRAKGHLYQPLTGEIISLLSAERYHTLVSDYEISKFKNDSFPPFSFKPRFIIANGISSFPFRLLENLPFETHLIFILFYEKKEKLPGSYVLFDYSYGVKLQIEHLLNCGYKNIIFFTHKIIPEHTTQIKGLNTVEQVLKSKNFQGNYVVSEHSSEKEQDEKIKKLLKKMGKNTGVICSQDDRTLPIYQAARLLNWDIPDDIGIIGYFNTPWVDTFFPSLTSVSIKEKEIAKKTSEIIIKNEEKEIIIKPELVVRDSTRR